MTFSTRPLARVSIACAAAALALSACSGKGSTEGPTTPTPSASASASESAEATPAPGEWTLEDLKVGAKVPKEDLERLFPKWEVPEPPATLTEFSEQGAKDAAIYYDRLLDTAFYNSDAQLINKIDGGKCKNCDAMRELADGDAQRYRYAQTFTLSNAIATQNPDNKNVYEVNLELQIPAIVVTDRASQTITSVDREATENNYAYVVFHNGAWTPIYLKLDRSHL